MSLNKQLTKIGMYLLSKAEADVNLEYILVGGLAVQAHTHSQFKQYHRPTIDADLCIENIDFKTFRENYGNYIAKMAKNKFDLGHHVRKEQFANSVQIIDTVGRQKDIFLLNCTRYQHELYEKIGKEISKDVHREGVRYTLSDLDITSDSIERKAKIRDISDLAIHVLDPDEVQRRKFNNIVKKTEKYDIEIKKPFEAIRNKMLTGYSNIDVISMDNLYEEIIKTYVSNPEQYYLEKDIYDFYILSKALK